LSQLLNASFSVEKQQIQLYSLGFGSIRSGTQEIPLPRWTHYHYTTDLVPSIVSWKHLLVYKSNITGCGKRGTSARVVTTKLMAYFFYQALPVFLFRWMWWAFTTPLPSVDKSIVIVTMHFLYSEGQSWSWLYGSWSYNYICNKCPSPLMLLVRISIRARYTTLCDKVCQWLAKGQWFSLGAPVSSTNKTDRHDITELLLKVVINTIKPNQCFLFLFLAESVKILVQVFHRQTF
jgi:hypothetical protein